MSPLLELSEIDLSYHTGGREVPVLAGVSVTVDAGDLVGVVGPSGSGKSSFLHVAAGLVQPQAGTVVHEGRSLWTLPRRRRDAARVRTCSVIPQACHLVPGATALQNVAIGLQYRGRSVRESLVASVEPLERVGLGHRLDFDVRLLSGGERQRVAIARALAGEPAMLLCDEPTGNLDGEASAGVYDLLCEIAARGVGIVLVTHDLGLADRLGVSYELRDRRLVTRPGRR